MRNNNAGCLNAIVGGFSRIMLLFMWIGRPVQFNAAFGGSFLLPCLGFLFLPFTTMIYVWFQTASAQPLTLLEWVILGCCVVLDIATIGSAGWTNRDRIPAGYPGSTQSPTSGGSSSS
jgi:putative effector of murein hydrolase LrgA (UPF0299 family)